MQRVRLNPYAEQFVTMVPHDTFGLTGGTGSIIDIGNLIR